MENIIISSVPSQSIQIARVPSKTWFKSCKLYSSRHPSNRLKASTNNGENDQELSPAQAAIQERIRKAREYKSNAQPSASTSEGPVAETRPSAQSVAPETVVPETSSSDLEKAALDEYNKRLKDYGAQLASSQQQELSNALQDLKSSTKDNTNVEGRNEEQQNKELLQRARKLAADKAKQVNASLYAQINRGTAVPELDSFSRSKGGADDPGEQFPESLQNREAALSGNADEAASYLKKAMSKGKRDDADLRPEQFTLKRDEEIKAKGVDFIASDKSYNPLAEDFSSYQPRSRSWGVFPRPSDISKAYGGGRTYRPGEALETNEQEQARKDKTAEALLEYRKKMGLFITPEQESKWTAVYTDGTTLMQAGQLGAAMLLFEEVLRNVSGRTKLGGEAELQRAICLDSLGQNEDAYKIYLQLQRHPSPEVQKRTKRMIFGFRAAENLKANTMSYAVGTKGGKEWEKYFTKLTGDWDSGYVGPSEDSTASILIAASVIVVPLAIAAILIFT